MAGKYPKCWTPWKYGSNKGTASVVKGHSGKRAVKITASVRVSGARALIQTPACAIKVKAGQRFDLSFFMRSTSDKTGVMFFRRTAAGKWVHWGNLGVGGASQAWKKVRVRTGFVPAGTTAIRFGLGIAGKGTIITDDYAMVRAPGVSGPCTDPRGCTGGKWKVRSFGDPVPNGENDGGDAGQGIKKGVRAMHAVLLANGKVLLIAGSGNSRDNYDQRLQAGHLVSWLYDPVTGKHKSIPTPTDMFCAGHVQLADGRVLVVGGTKKYPDARADQPGQVDGWLGEDRAYVFDPRDNKYHQTNNTNEGHWYPSATELGNGDIYSVGGYADTYDANGWQHISRVAERFKYTKNSKTGGAWLPQDQVAQTGINWATYPSLILMQDGRLFYSGSSVFGHPVGKSDINNYTHDAYLGPGMINPADANAWWPVAGLSQPFARDQSTSVLLAPAQRQRVMVMGGMDFDQGQAAHTHTDIVDLNAAVPRYKAGPALSTPKVYASAVLLPDGTLFETGGSTGNRTGYTHEAAVYDPRRPGLGWTQMAGDPVGRTYHNTALLLPDGRVMAQGSNPLSGFYETRISFFSPPYLFKGPRPKITGVDGKLWAYGSVHTFKTNRKIKTAWLIRPVAVTHSSDPNQRAVAPEKLKISGGTVKFKLTNNRNIAPPGWYMLFATDAKGVPSVAKWIHVG
ncbi:hypothetical protein GCM10010468_31400 [Actinocorallia longicatena]|uniref:Glyoxal oxidase-like protein n=2 Tax=Actinocorallia longicatena TaxID=111803 RepID=A0ABP6QBM6_9ACTN